MTPNTARKASMTWNGGRMSSSGMGCGGLSSGLAGKQHVRTVEGNDRPHRTNATGDLARTLGALDHETRVFQKSTECPDRPRGQVTRFVRHLAAGQPEPNVIRIRRRQNELTARVQN